MARFKAEILQPLDPAEVVKTLYEMSKTPTLLCYERIPFAVDNWCHRRIVAEWIEAHTGNKVEEVGGDNRPVSEILGFDIWA